MIPELDVITIAAKAALDALDERIETLKSLIPGEKNPLELRPGVGVVLVGIAAVLLIAVFFGPSIGHTHRWIKLAGFQFQPVEVAKVAVLGRRPEPLSETRISTPSSTVVV